MTTAEPKSSLGHALVVVNDEPYFFWDWGLKRRNADFLNGLDPEHFTFLIQAFETAQDLKRASVAVRTTLHHSLETLFSLLGALLQSPSCVYGWLSRCSTTSLRELVKRIGEKDANLFRVWRISEPSWEELSRLVFRNFESGTDKQRRTAQLFAVLWERLAHEFLNEDHMDEYNSIKHGLRVRPGGFTLRMAPEREKGVPAKEEEMQTLGSSEYGCSYLRVNRFAIEGGRSFRSKSVSLNWHMERDLLLTQLVAMSIQNAVSALRILNGVSAETVQFVRVNEDADFDRPWRLSSGVFRASFDFDIEEDRLPRFTKQDLMKRMNDIMAKVRSADRRPALRVWGTQSMRAHVTKIRDLTVVLKDLERQVKAPEFLRRGREFKNFSLRPRELLANLLICAAGNSEPGNQLTICTDPFGGDGLILDENRGTYMTTEHVFVPAKEDEANSVESRLLAAIELKKRKGKAYCVGKDLVIFSEAQGTWIPNRVARKIDSQHHFSTVWVVHLEKADAGGYSYFVSWLDTSNGNAPVWRVFINSDFAGWQVSRIQ